MITIYVLSHFTRDTTGKRRYNDKLIGVYSTRDLAERALARLRDKPGFRDCPEEDWWLCEEELDALVDWYDEGFADDVR